MHGCPAPASRDTAGICEHFSEPEAVLRTHTHYPFDPHYSDMRISIVTPAGEAIVQSHSSLSGRTTLALQVLIMTPQHGPKKRVCSGPVASHLISNYRNHGYFFSFFHLQCYILLVGHIWYESTILVIPKLTGLAFKTTVLIDEP